MLGGEKPDIPLETLNEAHPRMNLDFSLVVLISSLWEIWKKKKLLPGYAKLWWYIMIATGNQYTEKLKLKW